MTTEGITTMTTTTLTAAQVVADLNEAGGTSLSGGMLVYRRHDDGTYSQIGDWLSSDSRPRLAADMRALKVRSPRRRWTAAEVAEEWEPWCL